MRAPEHGVLGGGLLALAAATAAVGSSAPTLIAGGFGIVGLALAGMGWNLLRGGAPHPLFAAAAVAPAGSWLAMLAFGAPSLVTIPMLPMLTTAAFGVVLAVCILRVTGRPHADGAAPPKPTRMLPAVIGWCACIAIAIPVVAAATPLDERSSGTPPAPVSDDSGGHGH